METEHRKLNNKDNELISWQTIHQNEERLAAQICVQTKTRLVPAFVQLMRLIRAHIELPSTDDAGLKKKFYLLTESNTYPNRSCPKSKTTKMVANQYLKCPPPPLNKNLVSKTMNAADDALIQQSDRQNELHSEGFCCEPLFEIRSSGEPEAESGQLSKSCRHLRWCCDQVVQLGHPMLNYSNQQQQMYGILPSAQFSKSFWNRLFMECEHSAAQLLYALICYLEQNATISENVHIVEYKEADYFFIKNIKDKLFENFHRIEIAQIMDQVDTLFSSSFYPLNLIFRMVRPVILMFSHAWLRVHAGMSAHRTSMVNTLLDLLFNLLQSPPELPPELSAQLGPFLEQSRCNQVLTSARILAVNFCVRAMKSLTGTLFHFWINKLPLNQADMDDLNSYPKVFEGISDHVHAASHKIALLTGEMMRPYGFIMKATLEDNLPPKGWERKTVINIRLCLQECISLYTNWRFEFSTTYPPPVQIQNTRLGKLSIFYQSMVESLQDFQVLIKIAVDLVDRIQRQIRQGKIVSLNALHLPWTLFYELERNFAFHRIEALPDSTARVNMRQLDSLESIGLNAV